MSVRVFVNSVPSVTVTKRNSLNAVPSAGLPSTHQIAQMSDKVGGDDPHQGAPTDPPPTVLPLKVRKISFPVDAMFLSAIQEDDTKEIVHLLSRCDPGIDLDHGNHVGITPLHQSVLNNNLDAVKILLCHGADANAADMHGFTPLHTASACGFTHVASMLVVFGANVFLQTNDGDLAADLAKDSAMGDLLQQEMVGQIHSSCFWQSYLSHQSKEGVKGLLRMLVLYFLKFLQLVVVYVNYYGPQVIKHRTLVTTECAVPAAPAKTQTGPAPAPESGRGQGVGSGVGPGVGASLRNNTNTKRDMTLHCHTVPKKNLQNTHKLEDNKDKKKDM